MEAKRSILAAAISGVLVVSGALVGCASNDRSVGTTIDDSALTAKVKTQLVAANDVPWNDINVQTYRGVVTLAGYVDNSGQIQRAIQAARSVGGVKEVQSQLQLKPQK